MFTGSCSTPIRHALWVDWVKFLSGTWSRNRDDALPQICYCKTARDAMSGSTRRLEFHRLQLQVSTPPQRLIEYNGALQNIEQTAKCRAEMASGLWVPLSKCCQPGYWTFVIKIVKLCKLHIKQNKNNNQNQSKTKQKTVLLVGSVTYFSKSQRSV